MLVNAERLTRFAAAIVSGTGSAAAEADMVAVHLVGANLAGHDSHGVGMLPRYVKNWQNNLLKPNTSAAAVVDNGAVLVYDGGLGYGQRVALEAVDVAIQRSEQTGVALLGLRNAHHIGRIGSYGEQCLTAGKISLHFVNVRDHHPAVVPFGGAAARLITNPICIAMPGTDRTDPIVLDMATSRIAVGKVRVANNKGETMPEGMLINTAGQPETDPSTMFNDPPTSALLPFGEHKGYGLALFCELLAGALAGSGTNQPGNDRRGGIINGMLSIVIDPDKMVEPAALRAEVDAWVDYVKSSTPADPTKPVLIAGDPERRSRAERERDGVPVDDTTWQELVDTAAAVGIDAAQVSELAGVSA